MKLTHEEVGKDSLEETKSVKRNPIYVMCDNIRSITTLVDIQNLRCGAIEKLI
jgi:hypothetical protein